MDGEWAGCYFRQESQLDRIGGEDLHGGGWQAFEDWNREATLCPPRHLPVKGQLGAVLVVSWGAVAGAAPAGQPALGAQLEAVQAVAQGAVRWEEDHLLLPGLEGPAKLRAAQRHHSATELSVSLVTCNKNDKLIY